MEKEYWEEMKNAAALKKGVYLLKIKAMKAQIKIGKRNKIRY